MDGGMFALIVLGLFLGLRHGIDWDHLAAITDITGSVSATQKLAVAGAPESHPTHHHHESLGDGRRGFALATLYALGHGTVVIALGLLAIWASTLLPEWLDPIMERVVGLTLLLLGVWVFYALWRDGRSFRLRSRWMLFFSMLGRSWDWAKSKVTGQPLSTWQSDPQYGPKTAYAVGMIHGLGAETGSQALLLAGAAGATSALAGTVMLLSFTTGLLLSNSLVAAFSAFSFVSVYAKQRIYMAVGAVAGAFSIVVGVLFLLGASDALPDLQTVLNGVFGSMELGA